MLYRTKTYIAADWDNDSDAVDILRKWNDNKHLILSFTDAHDLTQSRDSSLNCSIKDSLSRRLDVSKTFILIVGNQTSSVKSGSCQYCKSYNSYSCVCARGNDVDYRSYIEYECEKAIRDGLKIVVLYNSVLVSRKLCPVVVRNKGEHIAMQCSENGQIRWDYFAVRDALSE